VYVPSVVRHYHWSTPRGSFTYYWGHGDIQVKMTDIRQLMSTSQHANMTIPKLQRPMYVFHKLKSPLVPSSWWTYRRIAAGNKSLFFVESDIWRFCTSHFQYMAAIFFPIPRMTCIVHIATISSDLSDLWPQWHQWSQWPQWPQWTVLISTRQIWTLCFLCIFIAMFISRFNICCFCAG